MNAPLLCADTSIVHPLTALTATPYPEKARGFYTPSTKAAEARVEKRALKTLTAWAIIRGSESEGAPAPTLSLAADKSADASADERDARSLALAAAAAGCDQAGPYERLGTRQRESHLHERGDELFVTAGALARARASVAILARYGPDMSLFLALVFDIIEYYRGWGNRRELLRDKWPAPSQGDVVASLNIAGGGVAQTTAAAAHVYNVRLVDKMLAALRLWVPLFPLPPGPMRTALLCDIGAYVVAAWGAPLLA